MKKSLLVVALLLAPVFAHAQWTTHGMTIPATHPRIWYTSSGRIKQAQTWLAANPVTCTSANYFCIAFKHVLTGSDCSAAVTWAANVNQATPVNGWPPSAAQTTTTAAGSDAMRGTGESAYLVFDWCYDQWSSGQKSAFVSNNLTWVQNVDQQTWGGYYNSTVGWMVQDNYYLGNMRNDLEFGIVAYGETGCGSGGGSACDNLIDYGINTRWTQFKNNATEMAGGLPEEGVEYGTAFTNLIFPWQTADLDGRDLYDESAYQNNMVYWLIYSTTPAATYNLLGGDTTHMMFTFGDDEISAEGGIFNARAYWQDWTNFASNYWASTGNSGKYARLLYNTVIADSSTKGTDPWYLASDSVPSAMPNYSALPLDYYATGIQYAYLRTAWDTSSTALMLQMGQSNSGAAHGHWDWGNFSIWRGGRWVCRESNGYDDIITGTPNIDSNVNQNSDSPLAHNVPAFTNVTLGQGADPTYMMPDVFSSLPAVNRLDTETAYFYADVDLTGVYLWNSGNSSNNTGVVGHVEREYIYARPLETLVVLDRILTANQTKYGSLTASQVVTSFLTHYETNPTITDSNHYSVTNGSEILRQTVLVPASATYRVINENSCSGCSTTGQYRVEVDNSGAAQRYSLDVLQSSASGTGSVTASVSDSNSGDPTTGTFTVTLTPSVGSATIIVFNKGETSSGGTINVAATGAVNLASGVENISYTDNGPIWGAGPAPPTGASGTAIAR
jgi:hypothetical protein